MHPSASPVHTPTELFAKEKPVVAREQLRNQYTSLEYLLAKAIAEIPLDAVFAAIFTTTLKSLCGLRIGWRALTGVFTFTTVAGDSLGCAIGSLVRAMCLMILFSQIISHLTQYMCCSLTFCQYKSPSGDVAMTVGVPILVVLMTFGIINPSGVDSSEPPPVIVEALKQVSPIAFAIKTLCAVWNFHRAVLVS
jgi:hypothetical protein